MQEDMILPGGVGGEGQVPEDEEAVRRRIESLLEPSGSDDAEDQRPSRRRHDGSRHHHHRRRTRLGPRSAKLAWWHLALILVVGLVVTFLVIQIASSPAGPPPE